MNAHSDSIAQLSDEVAHFVRQRDWDQFHDPKNLVMLVASEVGELLAEFRWVSNSDSDAHATGVRRERVQDEIADVAIGLLMLAARTGTDLPSAIRAKLDKNAQHYPAALSRGRADRPEVENPPG
jgi:NTP pyrophosphatase (non-canonical NTP hydrolase)